MKPPFPYFWGKAGSVSQIVPVLESVPHDFYAEPFCGSLAVLFAKEKAASEMANDRNETLLVTWEALKRDGEALLERIDELYPARHEAWFGKAKSVRDDPSSPALDRAASFLYCQFYSVLRAGGGFDCSDSARSYKRSALAKRIDGRMAERLADVVFLNRDVLDFIGMVGRRNKQSRRLVYLDPPYPDTSEMDSAEVGFSSGDFDDMLGVLATADFKFALSCLDSEGLRRRVRDHGWSQSEVRVVNQAGGRDHRREVLTTNFQPLTGRDSLC